MSTLYTIHYTRKTTYYTNSISYETYKYGLSQCEKINKINSDYYVRDRKKNPRFVPGTKNVLLKNARILDGIGGDFIGSLLLKDGIISELVKDEANEEIRGITDDTIVIDLKKKFVTPGLVDMHR